jgi:hypothetical protein
VQQKLYHARLLDLPAALGVAMGAVIGATTGHPGVLGAAGIAPHIASSLAGGIGKHDRNVGDKS